jgi:hypothetical protein
MDPFKCCHCLGVLREPVTHSDCGNNFCKQCLTAWIAQPRSAPAAPCPLCRAPLPPFLQINHALEAGIAAAAATVVAGGGTVEDYAPPLPTADAAAMEAEAEEGEASRKGTDYFVFVDTSGSMLGSKLSKASSSLQALFDTLGERDRLELCSFTEGPPRLLLPLATRAAIGEEGLRAARGQLRAEGGTHLYATIVAALARTGEVAAAAAGEGAAPAAAAAAAAGGAGASAPASAAAAAAAGAAATAAASPAAAATAAAAAPPAAAAAAAAPLRINKKRVIILTDGEDDGSGTQLAAAVEAIEARGGEGVLARLFFIAVGEVHPTMLQMAQGRPYVKVFMCADHRTIRRAFGHIHGESVRLPDGGGLGVWGSGEQLFYVAVPALLSLFLAVPLAVPPPFTLSPTHALNSTRTHTLLLPHHAHWALLAGRGDAARPGAPAAARGEHQLGLRLALSRGQPGGQPRGLWVQHPGGGIRRRRRCWRLCRIWLWSWRWHQRRRWRWGQPGG